MTLIQLVQQQISKGWCHKYQNSESSIFSMEVLHKDWMVVEICFRRSRTLKGRKCPDRFLSAVVIDNEQELEFKTLSELKEWFSTK